MSVNTAESLKNLKQRAFLVPGVMFTALHITSTPQAAQNKKQERIVLVRISPVSTSSKVFPSVQRSSLIGKIRDQGDSCRPCCAELPSVVEAMLGAVTRQCVAGGFQAEWFPREATSSRMVILRWSAE